MVTSGVGGFWTWRAGGGLATASSWRGRGPGLRREPGSRGCGRRRVGGPVAVARAAVALARDSGGIEEPGHAGGTLAVVEVADLQLHLAARRPEAVLGHGHGRALADDVTAEPEPADALQLQAHAGRLGQGTVERCGEIERLEDEELDADAAGVGRQPAQERLVGEQPGGAAGPARADPRRGPRRAHRPGAAPPPPQPVEARRASAGPRHERPPRAGRRSGRRPARPRCRRLPGPRRRSAAPASSCPTRRRRATWRRRAAAGRPCPAARRGPGSRSRRPRWPDRERSGGRGSGSRGRRRLEVRHRRQGEAPRRSRRREHRGARRGHRCGRRCRGGRRRSPSEPRGGPGRCPAARQRGSAAGCRGGPGSSSWPGQ